MGNIQKYIFNTLWLSYSIYIKLVNIDLLPNVCIAVRRLIVPIGVYRNVF